jgi:hypothetical protein
MEDDPAHGGGVEHAVDDDTMKMEQIDVYLESLEIFFAPTSLAWDIRRHVEGSIARNLRDKHPDDSLFYPNDNWTFAKRAKLGISVSITSDSPIRGLDSVLEV